MTQVAEPPLIFDIARGSLVDGPGIRTTIFTKGCPLGCHWCHNPEGQDSSPEIGYYSGRCNACGVCAEHCPNQAIDLFSSERIRRAACAACATCSEFCDYLALRAIGEHQSAAELVEIVLRDQVYFKASGGGVTFSGGEPLLHIAFLEKVIGQLREHEVHIAIETCGYFDYPSFRQRLLPSIDLILFDIKLIDAEQHRKYTGVTNHRIIENLSRLVAEEGGPEVLPRIPLVPGITTRESNLVGIAKLLRGLGITSCKLLGYNPSGIDKWANLGKTPPGPVPKRPMPLAEEQELRKRFEQLLIG